MKVLLKKIMPDAIAIVIFVLISLVYFFPADIEGRALSQHDSVAGAGSGQEAKEYFEKTGEHTRWTNSIFGGMPTYQMSPSYGSTNSLSIAERVYHLFLPDYVQYIFIMLLGFYILMRVYNFRVPLSVLGAVIWAFSSYFFIIIGAGHIWKFVTLAYIPPTIAGMVLIFRGRYVPGGLLTAFFVAMQIRSNHVQMSYYFLFVMLFMFIAYSVDVLRQKDWKRWGKATSMLLLAGVLGICINLSNLYHTYQYSKQTMRGKSELVKAAADDVANQTHSGLNRDYITQWSYGIGETWSLLVPNVKGGASIPLSSNETGMEKADNQYMNIYSQLGQYWGEQPGTAGPVYVGAFVVFLFILGACLVKGPMKWALVAATLLSILLSWGKNFMGFTDFFLDYVPMYDKFRAVSSILVIAEFTIPLLAILGLNEILKKPEILIERRKITFTALSLTAGVSLIFYLFPSLFFSSYVSGMEMATLQKYIPADQLGGLLDNLQTIRRAIFTADAGRSFIIILIGFALLMALAYKKINARVTVVAITVLCLFDMWQVNKRYLNDGMFVDKQQRASAFVPTAADKVISQDKTLDYRVLNFASDTFNENETAYWHESVGGYHAAKLRRYQEMIEEHISPEMQALYKAVAQTGGNMKAVDASVFPVINMLNTRWFIFPNGKNGTMPLSNPYAFGNAWFADKVKLVNNANEEITALKTDDPRSVAIVDKKFASALSINSTDTDVADSTAMIKLDAYEPNDLKYTVSSQKGGVVVFSEIYYPGWTSKIDGRNVEHGRADYILRAMRVPAGKHQIEFLFKPHSIQVTESIAYGAIFLLLIGAVLYFIVVGRKSCKK